MLFTFYPGAISPLSIVPISIIGGMDSFVLLAVPLFILVGELMNTGGITERLVTFARALVGHIRGSLGISTIIGEYIFSGISGSSVADVSAMGSLLIPAMKRAGYRPELAVSIVASASAMGMLVPPCIPMVVLANLTNLSVASLFIGGFLPAACMALLLIVLIYIQALRENIPRETRRSANELLRAFRRAILPLSDTRHHPGRHYWRDRDTDGSRYDRRNLRPDPRNVYLSRDSTCAT